MVDNFNKWISAFKDDFKDGNIHRVKIIQRIGDLKDSSLYFITPTENNKKGWGSHILYSCFFRTGEELLKSKEMIVNMCKQLKARAYISISPIKYNDALTNIIHQLLDNIQNPTGCQFNDIINQGMYNTSSEYRRVSLDVDKEFMPIYNSLKKTLENFGVKILCEMNSKTGVNLVTERYNALDFTNSLNECVILDEVDEENGITKQNVIDSIKKIFILYNDFANLYIPDFE